LTDALEKRLKSLTTSKGVLKGLSVKTALLQKRGSSGSSRLNDLGASGGLAPIFSYLISKKKFNGSQDRAPAGSWRAAWLVTKSDKSES